MPQIELTLANHGRGWETLVEKSLEDFTREHHVNVEKKTFSWAESWKVLVDISVHRSGADLSEVGSTWVPSLVSMNSLRPFRLADINVCGGVEAFMPGAWQTSSMLGSEQVWSIPFMSDVRVLYYWRDMLEKAGVDESTAFQSFDALRNTLERLKTVTPTPLLLQTAPGGHGAIYQVATWLWAAGSDFVSEDGKGTLLGQPQAREALREHFELVRYIPQGQGLMDVSAWKEFFMQRGAAVTTSGPWYATELFRPTPLPERMENLGVACLPGPGFVGGSNLVVWNHSYQEANITSLLAHLFSPQMQLAVGTSAGEVPTNREAAEILVRQGRPQIRTFVEALKTGRSLPAIPLWGLTEQRLVDVFSRIWGELCASPDADVLGVLNKYLPPLTRRLDIILAG